jgi:hypothetical protein
MIPRLNLHFKDSNLSTPSHMPKMPKYRDKKESYDAAQRCYREILSKVSAPLFTTAAPALPGSLTDRDSVALSLAVRTVHYRWGALHSALFNYNTSPPLSNAPTHFSTPTSSSRQPQNLTSNVPSPRSFLEPVSPSVLPPAAPAISPSISSRGSNVELVPELIEFWASYTTWLCSLGGLRTHAPILFMDNPIDISFDSKSEFDAAMGWKDHQPQELRWLVEVDMVGELLKAFPYGSPTPHPLPTAQCRIDETIANGQFVSDDNHRSSLVLIASCNRAGNVPFPKSISPLGHSFTPWLKCHSGCPRPHPFRVYEDSASRTWLSCDTPLYDAPPK